MADCIKTGAVVFLPEYRALVRADIYRVNDSTLVIQLGGSFDTTVQVGCTFAEEATATHQATIGTRGYVCRQGGTLVLPATQVRDLGAFPRPVTL